MSIPILGAMSYGTPDWAPWVLDEKEVRHDADLGRVRGPWLTVV